MKRRKPAPLPENVPARNRCVVGLMTGTSVDGVEAALVQVAGTPPRLKWKLLLHRSTPLDPALARSVLAVAGGAPATAGEFAAIDAALGETYAAAVLELLAEANVEPAQVHGIGLHGQTIFHRGTRDPAGAGAGGLTWQIGSAAVLAARTGLRVVHDFRSVDVAAGGEGAPLVPYADYLMFRSEHVPRVLLNLGGIANLTAMPAAAAPAEVIAFDTGPGNMLLDGIVQRVSDGAVRYDADGERAMGGEPDRGLLVEALADPFFDTPPPRSTGRERFGSAFLDPWFAAAVERGLTEADLLVTAAMLSASAVAHAIETFVRPAMDVTSVYASGGGTQNPVLMAALEAALDPIELHVVDELGMPSSAREAAAFAVLAHETLFGRTGSLPQVTGAPRALVLGSVTGEPLRAR